MQGTNLTKYLLRQEVARQIKILILLWYPNFSIGENINLVLITSIGLHLFLLTTQCFRSDNCLAINPYNIVRLIVLGFNNTSTLLGHFVLSPREREKRDRRDSRRDEREGQGRKRNRNESEETEEIKTFPLYPYLLQG